MSYQKLISISRSTALALGLVLSIALFGAADVRACLITAPNGDQVPCSSISFTQATPGALVDVCADGACDRVVSFVILPIVPEDVVLGDANKSGRVDLVDFNEFQLCYGLHGDAIGGDCAFADFDNDADIDLQDFAMFQTSFGSAGLIRAKDLSDWVDCADCPGGETYLDLRDSELLLPVGMPAGESVQMATVSDRGKETYVVVVPAGQMSDVFAVVTSYVPTSAADAFDVDDSDSGDDPVEDLGGQPASDDVIVVVQEPDVGGGGGGPLIGGGGVLFFFGGDGGDPIFGGRHN